MIVGPAIADTKEDSSWGGTYSYGFLLQKPSVTIRNLTIDGNANSHDHDFRAAVMTDHRTGEVFDNIIVQDVTVLHTNRRAIQIFSNKSTRSVGDVVTGNIVTDVTIGPGIIFFDADGEISHNTVSGITTMSDGSAIEGVQWSASGGMLLDIHGNTVSGVHTGIQIVVPRGGTSIVGNTMALAGGTDGDIGVLVRNASGQVTVQGNQITGSAKDAGIWMFGNTVAVMVTGNTLQSSASAGTTAGEATGIFMSDDGRLFPDGNGDPVNDVATYATMTNNKIAGFATGIHLYRNGITPTPGGQPVQATISGNGSSLSGATVGIDVYGGSATITGGGLSGNGTGVRVQNNGAATVNYSDLSGNTTGVNNGTTPFVDARYNWWGSPGCPAPSYNIGNVDVSPCAAALVSSATASTHEIGETGSLDTKVTVGGLYGVQFVLNHTPSVLTWDSGAKFNAGTAPDDWDWSKAFVAKNFAATSGQTALAATLRYDLHPNSANLSDAKLATWQYQCTGVGTSPLVYDTSVGTGSYLADKDGFNIPAVWLGDSITCVVATGSVDGYIKLQGRLGTNPHPASWYGAQVTLTCASAGCAGYGPYTMTTDDLGHYQWVKTGPGTGIAAGDYTATVTRRAYLGATKAPNVTVAAGATTNVTPTPTLLGGDVVVPVGIDILDLTAIGGLFGTSITADTGPDVNGDGWVNIFDLVLAGGNYGQTSSVW